MTRPEPTSRREFLGSVGALSAGIALPSQRWAESLATPSEFLYEPGLAYLQTGSLGPTPRSVMDRTIAAWRALERNPVFHGYGDLEHELDVVRANAATFLGCAADEMILTTCTTDGMNRVALGLALSGGDRVLTTDQEHPGG